MLTLTYKGHLLGEYEVLVTFPAFSVHVSYTIWSQLHSLIRFLFSLALWDSEKHREVMSKTLPELRKISGGYPNTDRFAL